jgi:cell division protein FtsB
VEDDTRDFLTILESVVAFVVSILTGLGAFIAARVWGQNTDLAMVKQNIADLRATVERMHAETLEFRAEIVRRLDIIDSQIRHIDDSKNSGV